MRIAVGAALAMWLASACSSEDLGEEFPHHPGEPSDPNEPGDEPGSEPGDSPPGDPPTVPDRTPTVHGLISGGRLHRIPLAGPLGARADRVMLLGAVEGDLRPRTGPLDPASFALRGEVDSPTAGGARLRHIDLVQTIGGVPIRGTVLQLTVREESGAAAVVASSFRLYSEPEVDSRPAVTMVGAVEAARQSLSRAVDREVTRRDLEVRDIGGRLELVWAIALRDSEERALVIASGPRAGRVTRVDERVHVTDGSVTGYAAVGGAPGGLGVVTAVGLPYLDVRAQSDGTSTDADGNFVLDVPPTETIFTSLSGRIGMVTDASFVAFLFARGLAFPVVDLFLGRPWSGELELAQVTAYVAADQTRSYLEANGIPGEALHGRISILVNRPLECDAFYDSAGQTLHFFRSGGGCNNSATDSIVTHEYTHFVDDRMGGFTNDGLAEGWGDLVSCYRLGVPEFGFDLFPGEALRSCENDYIYPPGGFDLAHALGQSWMGFAWRVRQGLIARYGEEAGDARARALVLPSLASNAADIPAAVREVFLRDDDDGDLSNQTPDWDILYPAALHHGVHTAVEEDAVPPAAVTDLAAASVTPTRVTLAWTAPGDDGDEGTAAVYEVRYSTRPITAANFAAATRAGDPPAPGPAGTPQTLSIAVPPATPLYFALVSRDDQLASSPLSNVVQATTPDGHVVYEAGAEDGLGGLTATGMWHVTERRAFDGTRSFWYGQESTGDYDDQSNNSGFMVTPTIDLTGVVDPILSFAQFIDVEETPWFDDLDVIVSDVDEPSHVVGLHKETGTTGGEFRFRVQPLGDFAGRRIRLFFIFSAIDAAANRTEGWYVDRIRITGDAPPECTHDVCQAGEALEEDCSPCATSVCAADPFCCEVFWDRVCLAEVEELCGETCTDCPDEL